MIYICGPYRDERGEYHVKENIRRAEQVALSVWGMGAAALCPHKNTAFFGGCQPDDVWLEGDLEMLSRCDALVTVAFWEKSEGALAEIEFAKENRIPIFHDLTALQMWLLHQKEMGRG